MDTERLKALKRCSRKIHVPNGFCIPSKKKIILENIKKEEAEREIEIYKEVGDEDREDVT